MDTAVDDSLPVQQLQGRDNVLQPTQHLRPLAGKEGRCPLCLRLLCSEARVDSSRVRSGFFSRDDWQRLTDAAGVLFEAPIYIDDSPDVSAMSIRAKSRRLKRDHSLGLVIIDYVQLMKGSASAERRDLEISEISRSLKALAKELNVPVLALSQLNRKLEERHDKRPQLSDLRESGALG